MQGGWGLNTPESFHSLHSLLLRPPCCRCSPPLLLSPLGRPLCSAALLRSRTQASAWGDRRLLLLHLLLLLQPPTSNFQLEAGAWWPHSQRIRSTLTPVCPRKACKDEITRIIDPVRPCRQSVQQV